jgi:histidinol-phosphate phosphatase family protein
MSLKDLGLDKRWTLFLDRDGVINRRIPGDYVKAPEALEILPGVPAAMNIFASTFGRIIIVTNQQGIGKGLMTFDDLEKVHKKMKTEIEAAGGRADAVFVAPMLAEENHIMRKPGVGMGLAARRQFPEISFRHSIMAGDSLSDMQFGKSLKMKTVLIAPTPDLACKYPRLIDFVFTDLKAFSAAIINQQLNYR